MLYDIVVIGGGPAGTAAAVYAARKKLKTLLITESFGGQSIVSDDIQNWIGEKHISGFDLAKKLEEHVRAYPDMVDVKVPEKVLEVKTSRCINGTRVCDFSIKTEQGNVYEGKTVILAAGARRRKLGVPGEEKLNGKGVAYCSTCDAPLFSGKKVAVIGGGNAGLEAAQDLFSYASEVYLFHRGEALKGDPVEQEEIKKNPKLREIILNAETLEILGDKFVTGLKYKNLKTGEEKTLEVDGVFVEIGSVPNSEIVKDLVELDQWGQVKIDAKHASTSQPGIFAAGDITDDPYKQNNISAGDAVKAALAAYAYLQKREKQSPAAEN
ncbi:MAG: FAD-dependent oxidoreductase [Candidatus Sungiibacteriota bacterium]|uniref:FAD-dependent oxidoreductase n=1 Tax=Candidatus Sungiibacteriota bacterium TaxID=2750080 RepID=A0A7T5RJ70_9BACT|nr:MAG: FAD-dependent oxidoreductase [Candidatus Sungbacteria bacterium]